MLNGKVYRAAFLPLLVTVIVVAFSLGERPRPIGTTLAPDAFTGARAFSELQSLERRFPDRRPGEEGDTALAEYVRASLARTFVRSSAQSGVAPGSVRVEKTEGETIDGERSLTTVIAERPGRDGRRILVIATRDAAHRGAMPELSATAALLELGRLFQGRSTRRTLTLVSTSGGTGGQAGIRALTRELAESRDGVDAAIVLGDLASRVERPPVVIPWSEKGGVAPLRLRRTVEDAVRLETNADPGFQRAIFQVARLAAPLTFTGQGPLGARGYSAVTLQASGEEGPDEGAAVSRAQLQSFGRAALHSIGALDNGPDVPAGPREYLVIQKRVLPSWAVRLLGAVLLLPVLLAAVDGLARVRRRRSPVTPWIRWLGATTVCLAVAALFVRLLGLIGALPAPAGAVDPDYLPPSGTVLAGVGLLTAGAFLARPLVARLVGAPRTGTAGPPGSAAALSLATGALAVAVWAFNPYTALLVIPAAHLWMLAAVPEVRLPRAACLFVVGLGFLPLAVVAWAYGAQLGLGPVDLAWTVTLLVSGGAAGPLGVLVWSALAACAMFAIAVTLRKPVDARGRRDGRGPSERVESSLGPAFRGALSAGSGRSAARR